MLRKLVFVLCAMSLTLASCGRQVTPNRPGTSGGLPSGFMQMKFSTYQPMDFTNVWYVVALNTAGPAPGTNGQPYAINGNQQQNWLNYSFEIIVYQLPGQTSPQPALIQFVSQQSVGGGTYKSPVRLIYNPQQLVLTPNCNGLGTQFCLLVDRHLFSGINGSPSPSPTGSASPTPTPTSSPTSSPSVSPSASPSPSAFAGTWNINWFTVTPAIGGAGTGGAVIDAPGPQGVNDQTWLPSPNLTYDTTTAFDWTWNAVQPPGWPQVNPPAAQIAGGEVLNSP